MCAVQIPTPSSTRTSRSVESSIFVLSMCQFSRLVRAGHSSHKNVLSHIQWTGNPRAVHHDTDVHGKRESCSRHPSPCSPQGVGAGRFINKAKPGSSFGKVKMAHFLALITPPVSSRGSCYPVQTVLPLIGDTATTLWRFYWPFYLTCHLHSLYRSEMSYLRL
jgi:hypothetical protein